MTETSFASLGFASSILHALNAAGFVKPTPIQEGAIPAGLAGRDGSGRMLQFHVPLVCIA